MAKKEQDLSDTEYVNYLNEMGALLSQCDGVDYGWNDVRAMEKRLLEGAPAKQPTVVQPVTTPAPPAPTKEGKWSNLALAITGNQGFRRRRND